MTFSLLVNYEIPSDSLLLPIRLALLVSICSPNLHTLGPSRSKRPSRSKSARTPDLELSTAFACTAGNILFAKLACAGLNAGMQ